MDKMDNLYENLHVFFYTHLELDIKQVTPSSNGPEFYFASAWFESWPGD
jgi:hypothetical protein